MSLSASATVAVSVLRVKLLTLPKADVAGSSEVMLGTFAPQDEVVMVANLGGVELPRASLTMAEIW